MSDNYWYAPLIVASIQTFSVLVIGLYFGFKSFSNDLSWCHRKMLNKKPKDPSLGNKKENTPLINTQLRTIKVSTPTLKGKDNDLTRRLTSVRPIVR